MSDDATPAKVTVGGWLLLDAGDPECNDVRAIVDSLGRDVQHEATQVVSALSTPLADVTAHCADGGEIARSLADLRHELDSLDISELGADRSWFARAIAKVPGVGTPADRYLQRLASSQARIASIIASLDTGRAVLSRDNITLRSDQERLHLLSTSLDAGIAEAQEFDDALVFAIDVELALDDPRRPLFEDELLDTCRQRMRDLGQAHAVNQQGAMAIESVMNNNREMIRGIDRTRELTLGALAVAATAGTARTRAAFDEIDTALNEIDSRRREALPTVERTVRGVTP